MVDAAQGVEAQTLATVYLALDANLDIVPVLNKIDLPVARPDEVKAEIEETIGLDASDALLVSAGFDAMKDDPLAGFTLEPEHYADLTRRLRSRWPDAPLAAMLEGGYAPSRLADGVLAHLGAL